MYNATKKKFEIFSETDYPCGDNIALLFFLVAPGLYSRHSDQLTGLIISSFSSAPASRFWYNTLKIFSRIYLLSFLPPNG